MFNIFIFDEKIIKFLYNTLNSNQVNYYFKLLGNGCLLVKKLLEDNGFIESIRNEEWTIAWSSGHIKLSNYEKLNKFQKMNHFPRSNELTRKDLLYKNLSKLKEQFPGTKFDFLPESYILPNEFTFLNYIKLLFVLYCSTVLSLSPQATGLD